LRNEEKSKETLNSSNILIHMEASGINESSSPKEFKRTNDNTRLILPFSVLLNYLHKYISKFHIYFHRKEFRRKKLLMGLLG